VLPALISPTFCVFNVSDSRGGSYVMQALGGDRASPDAGLRMPPSAPLKSDCRSQCDALLAQVQIETSIAETATS
jgi:hypothetical protein